MIFALIALALTSAVNPTGVTPEVVRQATVTLSVEETVRAYFADIPVMVQVARCESQFRHELSDGSVIRGKINRGDIGVMQINEFYHRDQAEKLNLEIEDLHDNLVYARKLYNKEGTTPWLSSSKCWGVENHIAKN